MSWESIHLEDLLSVSKGKKERESNDNSHTTRYIQIEDLRDDRNVKYCSPSTKSVYAEEKDILIAWDGANAGTVGYNLSGAIGSTIARLRLKIDSVHTPYVGRFLHSRFREIRDNCTGATIPHVSGKHLKSMKIPLPPLQEQKRIAAILDQADALRGKRRAAITKLNELLQSVFLDMFGDPVTNPKGWDTTTLSSIGSLDRGVSKHRPRNAPELLEGKYPLVQTGDVANSGGYIRKYSSTYSEIGLRQSKMWPKGTLCITIAANIANTGILTFDSCFPDSVVGFIPNKRSTTEFVQCMLGFVRQILDARATQVAQKNINLAILRALEIPVPPIGLQRRFSLIAVEIEAQKQQMIEHAQRQTTFFSSLQQRAFRGEL